MWWLYAVFGLIEAWYWLVYFPRAWRDGSNREIADMRAATNLMTRPGMPWGPPSKTEEDC